MFKFENYEPDGDWFDSVYDMARDAGRIIGIDVRDISFSGFWSQGDGASFIGSYEYAKGAAARIRTEFPTATDLHNIADVLQSAQRRQFYRVTASVSHGPRSNFYSHSGTMSVDVDRSDGADADLRDVSDIVRTQLKLFADWIYDALELEYEYQSAWQVAVAWKDLGDTASDEKSAARQLIRDIRDAMRSGITAAPSICSALRSQVRGALQRMFDARQERAEIEENFGYRPDRYGPSIDVAKFAAEYL